MKLRPRIDALEDRTKPEAAGLIVCGTVEEAAVYIASSPSAKIIVTGVPRTQEKAEL